MKRNVAVLLVVLVLLSGCSTLIDAPSTPTNSSGGTPPTTSDETPSTTNSVAKTRVEVLRNDSALGDVNATAVWLRVGRLVNENTSSPPTVLVLPPDRSNETRPVPPFYESLGATKQPYADTYPLDARYRSDGVIVLRPSPNTSSEEIEAVLAHEFAHAYQDNGEHSVDNVSHVVPRRSVTEGTAELAAWLYAEQYMTGYDREDVLMTRYSEAQTYRRVGLMPYVHGSRYARNVSEDGAVFEAMYDDPPTTAEQVLHGLPPGSEPPRQLAVSADVDGSWSWERSNRWGEAPLRYALSIGLTREQARSAATGWGNDRRMRFASGNATAWAWVIRWDDVAEANEFRNAIGAYRANVSVPLALHDASPETTVLVSGAEPFVRNTTVSGTTDNVTINVQSRAD